MISLWGTTAEEAIAPLVDAEKAVLMFLTKMLLMTLTSMSSIIRRIGAVGKRFIGGF